MSGSVPNDDVAILQRRLVGLDAQLAAYHGDYHGQLDIRQAACNAQAQINKLLGKPPQSPTGL